MRDVRPTGPAHRISVVEDHLLQRRRTVELLDETPGLKVVSSFSTFPDFLRWLERADARQRPDMVVLDLIVERGPVVDPRRVKELVDDGIHVLVLSAMASPTLVREVVRAGVGGVVGKRDSEEDIVSAVRSVLQGQPWHTPELAAVLAGDADRPSLSDQEERALVLYASGLTLPAVAEVLGVKTGTAKSYLDRVRAKYAAEGRPVRTKVDMHREARRDGFLLGRGRDRS